MMPVYCGRQIRRADGAFLNCQKEHLHEDACLFGPPPAAKPSARAYAAAPMIGGGVIVQGPGINIVCDPGMAEKAAGLCDALNRAYELGNKARFKEPICGQEEVDRAVEWVRAGAACGECGYVMTQAIYLHDGYQALKGNP